MAEGDRPGAPSARPRHLRLVEADPPESIAYTNRKQVTYYLCQGLTKGGKSRYYFARQPQDRAVSVLPNGYKIVESVNGVVSLTKDQPGRFQQDEIATLEAELRRHREARRYRVVAKRDRIEILESAEPSGDTLLDEIGTRFGLPGARERMQAVLDDHAHFDPILRFYLVDAARRTFRVERRCYLSSMPEWIDVYGLGIYKDFADGPIATLQSLARQLIPVLGTEDFFELH